MVEIKGIEKFAPKDFPGHLSATLFLGGCNFRCPYCHNTSLVLNPDSLPAFPPEYLLGFLDSRKNWLEGICISGGEPLMHGEINTLCSLIKDRGFLVKIDTNGSFPRTLQALFDEDLVDFLAMDIKAPLERYSEVVQVKTSTKNIQESIEIIMNSGKEYCFRTTVVPDLIREQDIRKIAELIRGAKLYQIQQFQPAEAAEKDFQRKTPYSQKTLEKFASQAETYVKEVRLEGV